MWEGLATLGTATPALLGGPGCKRKLTEQVMGSKLVGSIPLEPLLQCLCLVWWGTSLILALGRRRQANFCESEATLVYTVSCRIVRVT